MENILNSKTVSVPFLPGDTVCLVKNGEVKPYTVSNFYFGAKGIQRFFARDEAGNCVNFKGRFIGKRIFCTREEAEQALEEIKERNAVLNVEDLW